ncbi:unnamed protein product [Nesidiocoris tenuis]|uniref:Uncharacterized protein n=1 Tax=Nesidiocoris tenuis TaxID=355587 RepID=A0A6H5H036_9HEMI|nr:unnamed protein product [Nesidiocoris tenuis]
MVIISPKNIKKSYYEFCILLTRTLVNLRSSSIWSAGIGSFERTLALTLLVLKRSTGGGELSTTLAPLTLAELPIMTTTAPNTRPGSLGFRRERKYRKKGEKQKNHIAAIWGSRKSRPSAPPAMQQFTPKSSAGVAYDLKNTWRLAGTDVDDISVHLQPVENLTINSLLHNLYQILENQQVKDLRSTQILLLCRCYQERRIARRFKSVRLAREKGLFHRGRHLGRMGPPYQHAKLSRASPAALKGRNYLHDDLFPVIASRANLRAHRDANQFHEAGERSVRNAEPGIQRFLRKQPEPE